MSAHSSPEDRALLEVVAAAREAAEREIIHGAAVTHREALAQDNTSVVALVGKEATRLMELFQKRTEFFNQLSNMSWLQRKRLDWEMPERASIDWFGKDATVMNLDSNMSWHRQYALNVRVFRSGNLLEVDGELSNQGLARQSLYLDCEAERRFSFMLPEVRTYTEVWIEDSGKRKVVPKHIVGRSGDETTIHYASKKGKERERVETSEEFFVLGLVQLAQEQVKESVPPKIAEQW